MENLSIIDRDGEWTISGLLNGSSFFMQTGFEATTETLPMVLALKEDVLARREQGQGFGLIDLFNLYRTKTPEPDANSIGYCRRFIESHGPNKQVDTLSTGVIDGYLSRVHWANHSDSAKRDSAAIFAMLNYGRRIGFPVPEIAPPEFKAYSRRTRTLDIKHWWTLLDAAEHYKGFTLGVYFMLLAGARPGEAFVLTKQDVRAGSGYVTFRNRKGPRSVNERKVPLCRILHSRFKNWERDEAGRRKVGSFLGPGAFICVDDDLEPFRRSGVNWTGGHMIGDLWDVIKRRAGEKAGNHAPFEGLRLSDLRRSFATVLSDVGVPVAQIAVLLGHTNISQTSTYIGVSITPETTEIVRTLL